MSANFFVEATQLSQQTLKAIEPKRKKRTVRVVLDTNFIISALGLDDNPGSEAALALLDSVKSRNNAQLDIKLNVLPQTIDEATRTLSAHLKTMERIRFSNVVYSAAASTNLPSIVAKYFKVARQTGVVAKDYLDPYIHDLKAILKDKGIDVLEAHPAIYHQRPDVIDDVNDELVEDARMSEKRQKGYHTILHDVVLWHVVNDRRKTPNESPLDVDTWGVSLDWRLVGFDQRKRKDVPGRPPIILFPTNLLQLIQFWVPRTQELEAGVIDSLQLPLFFNKFDSDDERATIKILEVISRYENIDDLPESTIGNILANQALRARIKDSENDNAEITALIREEFIEENRRTVELLANTRAALHDASTEVSEATRQVATEEARRTRAESELEAERARREQEVGTLTSVLDASQRKDFFLTYVLLPVLLLAGVALLVSGLCESIAPHMKISVRYSIVGIAIVLGLSIALALGNKKVQRCPAVAASKLGRMISTGHRLIGHGVVGTALNAIYQGGAWDGLKALF